LQSSDSIRILKSGHEIALAQFNPTVGDFAGMPLASWAWRGKPSSEGRTLLFLPSFACAVIHLRIFWSVRLFWTGTWMN